MSHVIICCIELNVLKVENPLSLRLDQRPLMPAVPFFHSDFTFSRFHTSTASGFLFLLFFFLGLLL